MFESAQQRSASGRSDGDGWESRVDDTDYAHRHFVNLAAAVFLLVLAVLMVWTLKAIDAQESLRKCAASGRKDCIQIAAPPSDVLQAVR